MGERMDAQEKKLKKLSLTVANRILDELNGRKGYDDLWDDLDVSLRDEIRQEIAKIVERGIVAILATESGEHK